MITFFQKRFALSEAGAKDLRTAIISHTLVNLSSMLPVLLAFAFLQDYLGVLQSGKVPAYSALFYLCFAVCAFALMYFIAFVDYDKTYTKVSNESANHRIKLAETLRELPMSFFGKKDTADLSGIIMEDITQFEHLFSHAVPQLFAAAISMTVMGILMFAYDWRMSLAMFWILPISFLVFYLSKKRMKRDHADIYTQKRVISEQIQNGIDHVQEIKSYNQQTRYLADLERELDFYEKQLIKGELIGGALLNISHFMLKFGLPSVIFVGAYMLANGAISLFTYVVFLVIVGRIYDPFIDAMNNFAALLFLDIRIKRMQEMEALPRQTGRKSFEPKHFDIEFRNVNFSYQDDVQTIKNLSFIAKQGEVTALIGPSGGGKSTAAKLAARFWDVYDGEVLLGGENVCDIDPEALLKNFSIVFQDVALFNASITENIRLGRKGASDNEVKAAAKMAQCTEFIERLPDGYNTLIGENGEKLSGGERQRISIARALLKDAPVILLDEATASLDARNESKIQQAISALIKEKTVLIIAHRMRTVMGADKIVAIKQGQVVEQGRPDELKEINGVFAKMLQAQDEIMVEKA